MKKLFLLSFVAAAFIFTSCEGEDGAPGADGANGTDGTNGTNGVNGANSLIVTTAEAAGDNCANGGFRIDAGVDSNGNGNLDAEEITAGSTIYICDGAEGDQGQSFLVSTSVEEEGDNCANGGFRVDSGIDANENGVLDTDEIIAANTVYICNGVDLVNEVRGVLGPLVTTFGGFKTIAVESLVSTLDDLPTSDGGTMNIGGSADGAGMIVDGDGNLVLMVNFEDHYAVARLILDPVKLRSDVGQSLSSSERGNLAASVISADYMLNSSVPDFARQCSATMWEQDIHGGTQDIFMTASENWNHIVKGIDPLSTPDPDTEAIRFFEFGAFNFENAVPLPQDAYPGSTVVVSGDDDYKFNNGGGGSIVMYYSNAGDADFDGGQAYVMRLATQTVNGVDITDGDIDDIPADESDVERGFSYAVEFVALPDDLDPTVLGAGAADFTALDAYDTASVILNALEFVRVEDLDYGKGDADDHRTVYFAVTGRGPGRGTPNDWGTGFRLELDPTNPLQGTLTKILTGNLDEDSPLAALQSPDNICVTENYIYWQEDPNSFARGHQAYIWQTDLNGNNPQAVLQIDFNSALDEVASSRDSDGFNGEFGAMLDISDKIGEEGTFILCLQPHYWTNPDYAGIDGHDNGLGLPGGFNPREDEQGSQILVLRGVPR